MQPGTRTAEVHTMVGEIDDRAHGDGPLPGARWPRGDKDGGGPDPEIPESESNIVRGTD